MSLYSRPVWVIEVVARDVESLLDFQDEGSLQAAVSMQPSAMVRPAQIDMTGTRFICREPDLQPVEWIEAFRATLNIDMICIRGQVSIR